MGWVYNGRLYTRNNYATDSIWFHIKQQIKKLEDIIKIIYFCIF